MKCIKLTQIAAISSNPEEKGTKFISTYSLCANVSALISFSDPTNVTGKPLCVCVCVGEEDSHPLPHIKEP